MSLKKAIWNLEALLLLPGQCDVVILSNVLEHIEHRKAFHGKIQSSVQPNNCWIICIPIVNRDWSVAMKREQGFSDQGIKWNIRQSFNAEMDDAAMDLRSMVVNWGEIWAEVRPRAGTEPG